MNGKLIGIWGDKAFRLKVEDNRKVYRKIYRERLKNRYRAKPLSVMKIIDKLHRLPFWDERMSHQSDKEWRAHYYRYYRGKSCLTGQAGK